MRAYWSCGHPRRDAKSSTFDCRVCWLVQLNSHHVLELSLPLEEWRIQRNGRIEALVRSRTHQAFDNTYEFDFYDADPEQYAPFGVGALTVRDAESQRVVEAVLADRRRRYATLSLTHVASHTDEQLLAVVRHELADHHRTYYAGIYNGSTPFAADARVGHTERAVAHWGHHRSYDPITGQPQRAYLNQPSVRSFWLNNISDVIVEESASFSAGAVVFHEPLLLRQGDVVGSMGFLPVVVPNDMVCRRLEWTPSNFSIHGSTTEMLADGFLGRSIVLTNQRA